jgi:hypothetical protein
MPATRDLKGCKSTTDDSDGRRHILASMEGMGAKFVDVTPTVSKPEKKRWTGTAAICLRCANGGTCYKDSPRNGRCRDHVSDGTGDVTPTTDDKK